jgi:hypothetical protein
MQRFLIAQRIIHNIRTDDTLTIVVYWDVMSLSSPDVGTISLYDFFTEDGGRNFGPKPYEHTHYSIWRQTTRENNLYKQRNDGFHVSDHCC